MVDQQGLAGFLTGLRQLRVMAQHIDQAGLAYITAPDKCVLGFARLRTILDVRTGDDICGVSYHVT